MQRYMNKLYLESSYKIYSLEIISVLEDIDFIFLA